MSCFVLAERRWCSYIRMCRSRLRSKWTILYVHLAQVMEEVDFRDRTQSGTNLMARIRRFLQRAELDQNEVNILRGLLTAVQARGVELEDRTVASDARRGGR